MSCAAFVSASQQHLACQIFFLFNFTSESKAVRLAVADGIECIIRHKERRGVSHGGENHHLSLGTEKTLLSTVLPVYTALNADSYAIR